MKYKENQTVYYITTYSENDFMYDGFVECADIVKIRKEKTTRKYIYLLSDGTEHYMYELFENKEKANRVLLAFLKSSLEYWENVFEFRKNKLLSSIKAIEEGE